MKKKLISLSVVVFTIVSSFLVSCTIERKSVQLELHSSPWSFSGGSALSTLSQETTNATFAAPFDSSSFTIKLWVNLKNETSSKSLLKVSDVLDVSTFQHDINDRKKQNYPAYPMVDGSVPVLEASLKLYPPAEVEEAQSMPIGIPLAMLENLEGEHEVVLHFSGVQWTMYVDNELLDNDFALGYPKWGSKALGR